MTPDEMIAVIKASSDGKKLQYRNKIAMTTSPWKDRGSPDIPSNLNFASYDYRIKPEKKKLYCVYDEHDRWLSANETLTLAEASVKYHESYGNKPRIVTFVEE